MDHRFLEGQRALVTGGSGGLGRGICEALAKAGACVAFTWRNNSEAAQNVANAIATHGAEHLAIQADLQLPDAADMVTEKIEAQWEGVELLVNNAGMSESIPFVLISDRELMEVMEINFLSAFRLCRSCAKGMVRRKYGRIVNISSIAGSRSIPGPPHYAASKGALEGLTRSLAHELGPYNILVNAVSPGIFDGGLKSTIPEHHQKRYLDACALGRFGAPSECGELVAWLGSPLNTYTNGVVIIADGGTVA